MGTVRSVDAVAGRVRIGAETRRHYGAVAEQMRRNRSLHTEPFYRLALLTVAISESDLAAAEPLARQVHELQGPLAAHVWAATLAASNRLEEARTAFSGAQQIRRDFFHSILAACAHWP